MNRLLVSIAGILLFAFSIPGWSQSQQDTSGQSGSSNTTIRSTSQEVLLDLVFRDRKGRTIRDIRPEEVHVSEDGVEQTLTSFRLTEGNVPNPATASHSGPGKLDPLREIRL